MAGSGDEKLGNVNELLKMGSADERRMVTAEEPAKDAISALPSKIPGLKNVGVRLAKL